jgi:multidrug transporter EmrE-like cation transporter
MTQLQRILLICFACLMSMGQLLFKYGADTGSRTSKPAGLVTMMLQPSILTGLVIYALATILWIRLLQSLPLSAAYPYASLAFVIVPVCSVALFGETISLQYMMGIMLIIAGVVVISFSA